MSSKKLKNELLDESDGVLIFFSPPPPLANVDGSLGEILRNLTLLIKQIYRSV